VNCGQASKGHYALIGTDPVTVENKTMQV